MSWHFLSTAISAQRRASSSESKLPLYLEQSTIVMQMSETTRSKSTAVVRETRNAAVAPPRSAPAVIPPPAAGLSRATQKGAATASSAGVIIARKAARVEFEFSEDSPRRQV